MTSAEYVGCCPEVNVDVFKLQRTHSLRLTLLEIGAARRPPNYSPLVGLCKCVRTRRV